MNFKHDPGGLAGRARVCVIHHPRGRWEVFPLDGSRGIACETLEDARRIAHLSVAHGDECELVVRDAYHRVLEHGLIRSGGAAPSRSHSDGSVPSANAGG